MAQVFWKEALSAAAFVLACAVRTFSLKAWEEIGGREATRRFKLYRLIVCQSDLLSKGREKGVELTASHFSCAYAVLRWF